VKLVPVRVKVWNALPRNLINVGVTEVNVGAGRVGVTAAEGDDAGLLPTLFVA
jgi:hypothetical protein